MNVILNRLRKIIASTHNVGDIINKNEEKITQAKDLIANDNNLTLFDFKQGNDVLLVEGKTTQQVLNRDFAEMLASDQEKKITKRLSDALMQADDRIDLEKKTYQSGPDNNPANELYKIVDDKFDWKFTTQNECTLTVNIQSTTRENEPTRPLHIQFSMDIDTYNRLQKVDNDEYEVTDEQVVVMHLDTIKINKEKGKSKSTVQSGNRDKVTVQELNCEWSEDKIKNLQNKFSNIYDSYCHEGAQKDNDADTNRSRGSIVEFRFDANKDKNVMLKKYNSENYDYDKAFSKMKALQDVINSFFSKLTMEKATENQEELNDIVDTLSKFVMIVRDEKQQKNKQKCSSKKVLDWLVDGSGTKINKYTYDALVEKMNNF